MFKKIKEKWKIETKKAWKKDMEYIRNHPQRWKFMMISLVIGYLIFSCGLVFIDITAIIFVGICLTPILLSVEYMYYHRYREAILK